MITAKNEVFIGFAEKSTEGNFFRWGGEGNQQIFGWWGDSPNRENPDYIHHFSLNPLSFNHYCFTKN